MYNTKKLFSLNESGIKLPKGTHAAKILYHEDMDGIFSAILAYNQLKKQGIPDDKITFANVQYGNKESDSNKDSNEARGKTNKGQALVVVDFSAFVNNEKQLAKVKEDIKKAEEESRGRETPWIKGLKEKEKTLTDLIKKQKSGKTDRDFYQPDFTSDHHDNSKGDLIKGKAGKIGAKYPSDTEHISVSYANNIADSTTIKAVSGIDSAKYSRLLDTLELPTNFKEKGRMERLAIIVNSLIGRVLKKSPKLIEQIIRNSSPSLVSVYNNIDKVMKLSDKQTEALQELAKDSPDWKKIDTIRKELPKSLASDIRKENIPSEGKQKERFGSAKEEAKRMREKGKEDLENAVKPYFTGKMKEELEKLEQELKDLGLEPYPNSKKEKELKDKIKDLKEKQKNSGQFHPVNKLVIRQDATATRSYPSRYTGQLLSKDGNRFPFILKRFGTMIQIAANPDIDEELKKKIDLVADMKQIMENIEKKFKTRYNGWAFDVVKEESGGHSSITNVSGLGTLGLMVKEKRENLKKFQEIEARAKKVGMKMKDKMPATAASLEYLKREKEKAAEERKKIMNEIELEFYKVIKEKYKDIAVTKEQPEKYELKKNESFILAVKSLLS